MQNRNNPISVWHSQPFEVNVLDNGMQWGIVRYSNAKLKPGPNKLFRSWFILRQGQSFVGIGNTACQEIRSWQFNSLFARPKKKTISLKVRQVSTLLPVAPRNLAPVTLKKPTPPASITNVGLALNEPHSMLSSFEIRLRAALQQVNFELLPPADEPPLKGANDPI